jgi:hypothetical protein
MDKHDSKQEMSGNFCKVNYKIYDFFFESNASGLVSQIFKKPRSHLKILGVKKGDRKFHTDYFGTTRSNSDTRATRRPCFVHPCLRL